ncbi:ubiquinone/menaquinone biosynthesis-related protein [Metarhizium album ARSEF 1941]|uniref:Ubiquinone/menaquinone biosynthesis-related protein n=1 Tax=Metarhizium album (strain ARSEF 1941) TaxID=1081103 RepID=A0A0B2X873_METAS|nr:ubiquinone/menaquinone biosynthesis-related protein [Metarhizium album ARSEF 1941]KHO01700.1 ubiquinone/menaquinone biosynthesis-related protein [Metarhizium album ARSEF 1941]
MIVTTRGFAPATRLPRRFASTASKAPRKSPAPKPPCTTPPPPRLSKSYRPSGPPKPSSRPRYAPHPSQPGDAGTGTGTGTDTLQSLWRRSWLPLSGAALLSGFLGFYIVGTVTASLKAHPSQTSCQHATPTGRPPALTGDNAERFDKELDLPEWWMGITKLRRKLADHASGNVLELAVGTGRNLKYYNWDALRETCPASRSKPAASRGISSFTGLDISADMLDVARRRLVTAVPPTADSGPVVERRTPTGDGRPGGQLAFLGDRLRLICADAHHALPPPAGAARPSSPPSKATYDTIIQTFGLCSVADPVAVLCNLASAVKPDSGRIILLEHGKGWYGLVNGLLDRNADRHFDKYGCWWNRDIEALVDEAVQKTPGLEVVKIDRPNLMQMGTLVWVELRMRDEKK